MSIKTWTIAEPKEFYTVRELSQILAMDPERFRKNFIKGRCITFHQAKPGTPIRIHHNDAMEFLGRMRVGMETGGGNG